MKQINWCSDGRYMTHDLWKNGKKTKIYLHRFLTNCPAGFDVDHINGNKLDNRIENLRICKRSDNLHNSNRHKDNKSGLKGVSWSKVGKKWIAQIYIKGKQTNLGYFNDKYLAYEAYKEAAVKNYGEFAHQ